MKTIVTLGLEKFLVDGTVPPAYVVEVVESLIPVETCYSNGVDYTVSGKPADVSVQMLPDSKVAEGESAVDAQLAKAQQDKARYEKWWRDEQKKTQDLEAQLESKQADATPEQGSAE